MTMLPVCSATPSCSSHPQITFHEGLRPISPFRKDSDSRRDVEGRTFFSSSKGTHLNRISFRTQAAKSLYSTFIGSTEKSVSMDLINTHSSPNILDNIKCRTSDMWSCINATNKSHHAGSVELKYVGTSSLSPVQERFDAFKGQLTINVNDSIGSVEPETISTVDITLKDSISLSDSIHLDNGSLFSVKTGFDDLLSWFEESFSTSSNKGENAVKSSLDILTSSITSITKTSSEAVDNALSRVLSTVDQKGSLAANKFTSFSSDLKQASIEASVIAIDLLRRTIVLVEDSIISGAALLVYSYGIAKGLLPPEIKDALNFYEGRAIEISRPIGTALQQVYITIEGLERNLGLDPDDPIVPFVLFIGISATSWVSYWLWVYSGYSGDLSPKSTLELLRGKENAVLIDVRPEVLREKDGIPDLRRATRSRYASVIVPEVSGPVRKMLKNGRDLDDTLVAVVIRNLKNVLDRSKVIVMDADGTHSKGIARSLRKLGVKRSYLVQGGFHSWVKQGLRVKELKPETTLTILSEEAEAIIEDMSPSPLQVLGFGVGSVAALYALLEWEKTLQYIGVFGLSLTVYRRFASYEDAEDFRQDVRLLLAPVRLGAQAFSWAVGKLETNRIGLPTSPSSSEIQNRVLQAAAKHESKPSDTEGIQDPSPEGMAPINENVDLSEA